MATGPHHSSGQDSQRQRWNSDQARRDCGLFLDRIQVTRASRSRECESLEGSAHRESGSEGYAAGHEADDLWRVQCDCGRDVVGHGPGVRGQGSWRKCNFNLRIIVDLVAHSGERTALGSEYVRSRCCRNTAGSRWWANRVSRVRFESASEVCPVRESKERARAFRFGACAIFALSAVGKLRARPRMVAERGLCPWWFGFDDRARGDRH